MESHFSDPAAVAIFSAAKLNKISLFESPRMFCDVYCLEPRQEQRLHEHADNDKIYYALSGTCRVTVGEEERALAPGQLAIAPAGVPHGVVNDSGARATLLVVMAPHPSFEADRDASRS